jgi:hypothetical protein
MGGREEEDNRDRRRGMVCVCKGGRGEEGEWLLEHDWSSYPNHKRPSIPQHGSSFRPGGVASELNMKHATCNVTL